MGIECGDTPVPNIDPTPADLPAPNHYIKNDFSKATPRFTHILPNPRKDIACEVSAPRAWKSSLRCSYKDGASIALAEEKIMLFEQPLVNLLTQYKICEFGIPERLDDYLDNPSQGPENATGYHFPSVAGVDSDHDTVDGFVDDFIDVEPLEHRAGFGDSEDK